MCVKQAAYMRKINFAFALWCIIYYGETRLECNHCEIYKRNYKSKHIGGGPTPCVELRVPIKIMLEPNEGRQCIVWAIYEAEI